MTLVPLHSPNLCPLQVTLGKLPIPTLGGALCHHWQGLPAIWTSLPQPWPLPEHRGPRKGRSVR